MKKSYLMIAAAAGLMLTACSQEDDFVAQNAAAQQGDGAVLFDTYLSNTSTRAGQPGVMTTSTLQKTGFGIMAATHSVKTGDAKTAGENIKAAPNFMWNQYVGYEASNWIYSPLKYWPNETTTDQQKPTGFEATSVDDEGVSFFAYAPYVNPNTTGNFSVTETVGITNINSNTGTEDPWVKYVVATGVDATLQPSKSVDLLWGVSSGFSYHPVKTGAATTVTEGLPVLNMTKPAIEEKIKFDFKHALARIGMTVVGAFDQVAAGGTKDNGTRVTIKSIKVENAVGTDYTKRTFATSGKLDLNNGTAHRANWIDAEQVYNDKTVAAPYAAHIEINNEGEMNPHLRYGYGGISAGTFPKVAGVLSTPQDVITPPADAVDTWKKVTVAEKTPYSAADGYFTAINTPLLPEADLEYATTAADEYLIIKTDGSNNNVYVITATKPATVDLTQEVYSIVKEAATAIPAGTKPAYDPSNTYFKLISSGTWIPVSYDEIPNTIESSIAYYTIPTATITTAKTKPVNALYKATQYYKYVKPGYFMVIPTTGDTPADRDVNVIIDYFVTTNDSKLSTGTSEVHNVIKQKVTLKEFTNGKAYNLKLILGLTSVKVDAEVSNWEVGTVESNLPQNLE